MLVEDHFDQRLERTRKVAEGSWKGDKSTMARRGETLRSSVLVIRLGTSDFHVAGSSLRALSRTRLQLLTISRDGLSGL